VDKKHRVDNNMTPNDLHFDTIEELTEWLTENNKTVSDLFIQELLSPTSTHTTIDTSSASAASGTVDMSNVTTATIVEAWVPKEINVKSLTKQPNIQQIPFCEGIAEPNIWYVDDYEFIEDACGTSRVVYRGDTLLMNVCESSGDAMVSLVIETNNNVAAIKFKLNKICNAPDKYDMILSS
jgi:hypothetical protein